MSKPKASALHALFQHATASGTRALGSLASLAATILVTAKLGAHEAGLFFGTLAWIAGATIVARWGAADRFLVTIPHIAQGWRGAGLPALVNRSLIDALLRSALMIALLALFLQAGQAVGLAFSLSLPVFAVLLPGMVVLQLLASALRARGATSLSIGLEFLLTPLIVCGTFLAWPSDTDSVLTGMIYAAASLLSALLCFLLLRLRHWHFRPARRPAARERTRASNFAIIELSNFINGWMAMLFLPLLLAPAEVGTFNLAFRIASAIGMVASTVYSLALPRLSVAAKAMDWPEFDKIRKHARLALGLSGLSFAALLLLGGAALLESLGPEFLKAQDVLFIMVPALALSTLTGPNGAVLAALGQERLIRNTNIIASVLGLLVLWPASHFFGMSGAAYATATAVIGLKLGLLFQELRLTSATARQSMR